MSLTAIIEAQIAQHGFITVADYMQMCLLQPEFGYYTTQTVFGTQGDFTTAPEISQLFGETLGVWAMLEWERLDRPAAFNLVELGPGRGVLMADLLRASTNNKDFTAALSLHLVEASARLRGVQKTALEQSGVMPTWHDTLETLPFDRPTIVIANEFFDALPVRQFIIQNQAWHERVIVKNDDSLAWFVNPQPADGRLLPSTLYQPDGMLCEYSAEAGVIFKNICTKIKQTRGSILAIDYGDHTVNRFGDTLQAVKAHEYSDVLSEPGTADLTTPVDFYALDEIASKMGLQTSFATQGDFLKQFGITERLQNLSAKAADTAQRNMLVSGYQRLIDPDQMGDLFKVLQVMTR